MFFNRKNGLAGWVLYVLLFPAVLHAQDSLSGSQQNRQYLPSNVRISGLFYLAAQYKTSENTQSFSFLVRRAYMTVQGQLAKNLSARYTQDITIDDEGDDAGNIELRIKYLYLQYQIPNFWVFRKSHFKFGIVQRPWLDFEEHINAYRVQGTMFMERSGLFNSAGFGVSFESLLGGTLPKKYLQTVHPHSPGRYGSFAIGLYNGGGYHRFEQNLDKNVEVRLTLRPFPERITGLQFSYLGIFGTGNIPETPAFYLNAGIVTYEGRYVTLTAQYEAGKGNSYGTFIDSTFQALPQKGYSFYGEVKIPKTALAVYARYDHFSLEKENDWQKTTRYICGASWRFYKRNKLVFSYQQSRLFDMPRMDIFDLALDVAF